MIQWTSRVKPDLPFSLQAALALPLSSTYSPGAGFFYGLINNPSATHSEFMSRSLVLTILLFHLSVIIVWLICRALGSGPFTATIAALWMMFSISEYSYGYHLGSTVWNVFASSLWFFAFNQRRLGKMTLWSFSWLSGGLFCLNYLLLPLWIASVLFEFGHTLLMTQTQNRSVLVKSLFGTLLRLIPAMGIVGIAIVLFVQPSAGVNTAIRTVLPSRQDSYYIVANFLSFFSTSGNARLSVVLFLVLGSMALLRKKTRRHYFWIYLALLGLVIVGMSYRRMFALTPSRHVLFLTPLMFALLALGLEGLFSHLKKTASVCVLLLVMLLGIVGIVVRTPMTQSAIDGERIETELVRWSVKTMVIYGCSHDLYLRAWRSGVKTQWVDQPLRIEKNTSYAQLSQTQPVQTIQNDGIRTALGPQFSLKPVVDINRPSQTYFIAFNPDPKRFVHHTPNGFHFTIFKVEDMWPSRRSP
jgi:hypothetical protein